MTSPAITSRNSTKSNGLAKRRSRITRVIAVAVSGAGDGGDLDVGLMWADPTDRFETLGPRYHQIGDGRIEFPASGEFYACLAAVRRLNAGAPFLDQCRDKRCRQFIVIDYENAGHAALTLIARAYNRRTTSGNSLR